MPEGVDPIFFDTELAYQRLFLQNYLINFVTNFLADANKMNVFKFQLEVHDI